MFEEDEIYQENYRRLIKIAQSKGYILNSNPERVNKVIGLMSQNFREYGKYLCPCKQNDPDNTGNNPLCPCPEIDQEISENGCCYCKLFFIGET
jgi:ferredoxin-thioredoxin reductase catalytic subunit